MAKVTANRVLSLLVSFILVAAFALPASALAAQPQVEVENHTGAGQTAVSDISIDGVDAPAPAQEANGYAAGASTAENKPATESKPAAEKTPAAAPVR